jgi:hypothetical protein
MMNRHERRAAKAQARRQSGGADEMVHVGPYLKVPRWAVEPYTGLLTELTGEANQRQPPFAGEFGERAAALHEASHCAVAVREGYPLKTAAIERQRNGLWLGEFWLDIPAFTGERETFLAHLRITLAGRRGELLFTDPFCMRAGLNELAYALLMVMIPLAEVPRGEMEQHYPILWGSLLAEVDDTLRAYSGVVHEIADRLMRVGRLHGEELMACCRDIPARPAPPALRSRLAVETVTYDPLAYASGESAR